MAISPLSAATFALSIIFQVAALSLMPMTRGFTALLPTIGCVALFGVGLGLLARLLQSGVDLGILIPLSSASVPIATMIVSILVFSEPASAPKIGLLVLACALIGVAGALNR